MNKQKKTGPLEDGVSKILRSLANQIARELQRSPEERRGKGYGKSEPYAKRVEQLTALLIEETAENENGLDGLLVLSQASIKALHIFCDELGEDGLGKVRSAASRDAVDAVLRDAELLKDSLTSTRALN